MKKLTNSPPTGKPVKPYSDFPLFAHGNGQWAKKVPGRCFYFGTWDDPEAALQRYVDHKDDLMAGRVDMVATEGLSLRDLVNAFLTSKKLLVETGDLSERSFDDYYATCERLLKFFGKSVLVTNLTAANFEQLRADFGRRWSASTVGNEVQRVHVVCKYAYDAELIEKPIRYGPHFKRPSKRRVRQERHEKGPRMFEAHEIPAMLDATKHHLRAMILLGINCAYGNHDVSRCAGLRISCFAFCRLRQGPFPCGG